MAFHILIATCLWAAIEAQGFAADNLLIKGKTSSAIKRRDLNFTQLVEYDGYKSDWHRVTTSDGYVLSIFRVQAKGNACAGAASGEPLVFMHGLYLSGDDCVTPGPGAAHCYVYADACRDVWVPNARGSVYSRAHTTLNLDTDSSFWDFAFDEMALYDMPAIIDYVLEQTGSKQLSFVGHSQGPAALLLLCAKQPAYNDKIKVGFGLSMIAWLDHARFVVIKAQEILFPWITKANNLGVHAEFLPRNGFYQPYLKLLCGTTAIAYPACSAFYFTVLGYDRYQITPDVFTVLTGHLPSGLSLKNFGRWGQMRKNGFTEPDYGIAGNLAKYGTVSPPPIELSAVTMKWIIIGSYNDYVSDVRDIDTLSSKLPNATKCIVSDKTFGHLDFLYGKDVPNFITPMILNYLDTGNFKCL